MTINGESRNLRLVNNGFYQKFINSRFYKILVLTKRVIVLEMRRNFEIRTPLATRVITKYTGVPTTVASRTLVSTE